ALDQYLAAQPFGIEPRHVAGDIDVAEMLERAFLDHEVQRESLDRGIKLSARLADIGIGIAVAAIILPDQLAIIVDPVRIVDVAAGQEAQYRGLRCLDHGLELAVAEDMIAGEID